MTTIDLTKQFEALRNDAISDYRRNNLSRSNDNKLLNTHDSEDYYNEDNTTLNALTPTLPPKWFDLVGESQELLRTIENKKNQLKIAHANRLKVSFGDDSIRDNAVQTLEHDITSCIKKVEVKIKRIATDGIPPNGSITNNDATLRANVMRKLGILLKETSKSFQQQQKAHLTALSSQQNIGNEIFREVSHLGDRDNSSGPGSGGPEMSFDQLIENGLNKEQIEALEELDQRADERTQEIISLAQAINQLAELFTELNVLVIEQGTILDRIDFNIEQTLHNTIQAREELDKAEAISKKNWTLKAIIIFFLIILVEVIVLIIKYKLRR